MRNGLRKTCRKTASTFGKVPKIKGTVHQNKTEHSSMNPSVRLVDIGPVNKIYRTLIAAQSPEGEAVSTVNRNNNQSKKGNQNEKNSSSSDEVISSAAISSTPFPKSRELQPVVLLCDFIETLSAVNAVSSSSSFSSFTANGITTSSGKSLKWKVSNAAAGVFRKGCTSFKLRGKRRPPTTNSNDTKTQESLKTRGLIDFKLSDMRKEPKHIIINVDVITQFLVDAVTMGNALTRHNRPFDLANPREECYAVAKSLSIYADRVAPMETIGLFQIPSDPTTGVSENPLAVLKSGNRGCGLPKEKTWIYLSNLDKGSKFFNKMKRTPGAKRIFEEKMLSIMQAGMGVDSYNWTLSEVGYILGFWLAKLYNAKGVPDEGLPREVVLVKEQFLELNGWEYDDAVVK